MLCIETTGNLHKLECMKPQETGISFPPLQKTGAGSCGVATIRLLFAGMAGVRTSKGNERNLERRAKPYLYTPYIPIFGNLRIYPDAAAVYDSVVSA